MNTFLFDRCRTYLSAHSTPKADAKNQPGNRMAITISREAGAGAVTIAQLAAEYLQSKKAGDTHSPWAVFDRSLVSKVLKDHNLPDGFQKYMAEDATHHLEEMLRDLFETHPSTWALIQNLNRTILRLAMTGNVILVGRGSHIVTARLPHTFHVRLVAPLEFRIKHVSHYYHFEYQQAAKYVHDQDKARSGYLRSNFESNIQDPLQFHITINTGKLTFAEAAQLIAEAALAHHAHRAALPAS